MTKHAPTLFAVPSLALLGMLTLHAEPEATKRARHGDVAPINAVTGDASWLERFGHLPTREEARAMDDERHRVHLAWIERKLRTAPVDHLRPDQRRTRAALLDALREYREIGVHPINERGERLPRFLDRDGRICAVGYMIEKSAGRELVERVNARWEYDYLLDIRDPELDAWIESSGFTARELASIQPTGYAAIDGGGIALVLAGIFGGPMALGADVALLATAAHYGDRGMPTALAIVELIWGAAHFASLGTIAAFDGASEAGAVVLAAICTLGAAEAIHAIWSLAEPDREVDPEEPRVVVGASPTEGGVALSLAGTF